MGLFAKIPGFWKKHRFPLHLVVLWDIGIALCCCAYWTLQARWMLWLQGCRCGPGFRTDGRLIVRTAARGGIRIGDHFRSNSRQLANLVGMSGPSILCCYGEGRIEIGDHTGMSSTTLSSRARVRVGNHVNFGGNAKIYDHDFHSLHAADRREGEADKKYCKARPVEIGDDVFVGAGAILLKGTVLGDRCIVGAGAVVAGGEYPPDSILAGNPARIIKPAPPPAAG